MLETERFQRDLNAAHSAGVPMLDGRGRSLNAGQLKQLHDQFEQATQGLDSPETFAASEVQGLSIPNWYASGFQVFSRTGSMLPVFEGLDAKENAIGEVTRALRWTFLYPLILAATALAGLFVFNAYCVEPINEFRADMKRDGFRNSFDGLDWLPIVIWIVAAIAVLLLILLLLVGTRRLALWIGGQRYVNYAVSGVVLRIAQPLVHSGMSLDESINTACTITDAGPKIQSDVRSVLGDDGDEQSMVQMADCQIHAAQRTLSRLKNTLPVLMIVLFGGSLALVYGICVLGPIFAILNDLPQLGVNG